MDNHATSGHSSLQSCQWHRYVTEAAKVGAWQKKKKKIEKIEKNLLKSYTNWNFVHLWVKFLYCFIYVTKHG